MNIMTKAAITSAIAGLSLGACAQHDVSIGLAGATNYATMMVSNNGTIDIAAVELFTGTFRHGGAEHHRDVNAALNIAARGHARLAGGIPVL